jgi:hypothetical protein
MDLLSSTTLIALAIAFVANSACVLLHYEGLSFLSIVLPMIRIKRRPRILLLIYAVLLLHSFEIGLYAILYYWLMATPGFGTLQGPGAATFADCIYYSTVVFSTLGLGDILPHGPIRMLTAGESLAGFVLITWSASFAFLEMQSFWRRH